MVDTVIVGSMALDTIKTPFGFVENVLGGSATYAGFAASFFSKPGVVSVVGKDFPQEYKQLFLARGIDLSGIETVEGKTFHWEGCYEFDMNAAKTIKTELNALEKFNPVLPHEYRKSRFLFLGNFDPELQLKVLQQMHERPKLVVSDTMNYYIENKREKVLEMIRHSDIALMNDGEARQLFKTTSLVKAAREILKLDSRQAIIKKGEHGALLVTNDSFFLAPGFPLENVVDPTGAGDSFAGAFIGYLSRNGKLDEKCFRKAIVYASAVASFNAEGFSLNRLCEINLKDINKRVREFKKIVEF